MWACRNSSIGSRIYAHYLHEGGSNAAGVIGAGTAFQYDARDMLPYIAQNSTRSFIFDNASFAPSGNDQAKSERKLSYNGRTTYSNVYFYWFE